MIEITEAHTVAVICLIIAAAMIALTEFPVAWARKKQQGVYDNRNPRMQQARLTGYGARALGAHQNTIEAFPIFAAGVLLAIIAGVDSGWLTFLTLLFTGARLVYMAAYLADVHLLRSLSWMVGFGASIALMLLPLL